MCDCYWFQWLNTLALKLGCSCKTIRSLKLPVRTLTLNWHYPSLIIHTELLDQFALCRLTTESQLWSPRSSVCGSGPCVLLGSSVIYLGHLECWKMDIQMWPCVKRHHMRWISTKKNIGSFVYGFTWLLQGNPGYWKMLIYISRSIKQ